MKTPEFLRDLATEVVRGHINTPIATADRLRALAENLERTKAKPLARRARELAEAALRGPCANVRGGITRDRCLEREWKRRKGQDRVSFRDYRPSTMCDPCAAYWYAECAAMELERIERAQREQEREGAEPDQCPAVGMGAVVGGLRCNLRRGHVGAHRNGANAWTLLTHHGEGR